jgi:hypothetical protein
VSDDTLEGDIAEVARRHGVLLGSEDPILIERTLAERRIAPLVARIEAAIDTVEDVPSAAATAVREQVLPMLEAMTASNEIAGQIAKRPFLTSSQVDLNLVPKIVGALHARTVVYVALVLAAWGALCFGAGTWWQSDRDTVKIERMENDTIATKDGFGTELKVSDAALWLDLIRKNPGLIADSWKRCNPIPQTSGTACLFPLWVHPPSMAPSTPAVH